MFVFLEVKQQQQQSIRNKRHKNVPLKQSKVTITETKNQHTVEEMKRKKCSSCA